MTAITALGDWATTFQQVYDCTVIRYRAGARDPATSFPEEDAKFLASIGCSPRELHDFVEDWCDDKVPTFETVLRITTIQRDYFLHELKGHPAATKANSSSFPEREAELGGHRWLPRIIAKARAKLRGELPQDLMYSCGADRQFLTSTGLKAPEFLETVRNAGDDDQKILEYVQQEGAWPGQ